MGKIFTHTYNDIISTENLLEAWQEFRKGKKKKLDVQEFEMRLMSNIISLHKDLKTKSYTHGPYKHFVVSDPKKRDIHKASVRDRVLHHAIYRQLYPFFDTTFTADSFSCRDNKGTHRAIRRFEVFTRKVSRNYTKQCWVLKCDICKFFASIEHKILLEILESRIKDEDIMWLLRNIVESFSSNMGVIPAQVGIHVSFDKMLDSRLRGNDRLKGLPLGNLTSQLLVNIYMNEFDQFAKHVLKAKYYIRYADDFVFISQDKDKIEKLKLRVAQFLEEKLCLQLHPDKVFIQTIYSGIDFLGWVHFPHHRVLRTTSKKRMFRKLNEKNVTSYLGLLSHGNGYRLQGEIRMKSEFSNT